ncbi:unnamed protein product [Acanthoscelides obtectus]|uniref:Uncharacterized protein n=1 Tax=Acanthoscelides obtectus TaxID=200917 RepID=A0A9P0L3N0_ACAOB|nr:unnamed protein product [Acanthoscelides obtectus]CAK1673097.1 hypothetical protein AOBTE_LOCUS29237 [Acanthoscelides obtectus]
MLRSSILVGVLPKSEKILYQYV